MATLLCKMSTADGDADHVLQNNGTGTVASITVRTSELTHLKRQRGGNVGYLKKVIEEVTNLVADASEPTDTQVTLAANKDILIEINQILKEYHDQILQFLETEEDINQEIEVHSGIVKEIRKSIHLISKPIPAAVNTKHLESESRPKFENSARLPKLQLKPFDGNPLAFQRF